MARIAFLTLEKRHPFVIDDGHAILELTGRGHAVEEIPWSKTVDWASFDAVIVRTTWDYHRALDAFLAALEKISATGVRLMNPPALVAWNARKTYLRDLDSSGVKVVPTLWGEGLDAAALPSLPAKLGAERVVLKPQVSANAEDTFPFDARIGPEEAARIASKYTGRGWMAQPFVRSINTAGEVSLFYFSGAYSHAVRKVPAQGDFRVQEEHGGDITGFEPDAAMHAAGKAALAALKAAVTGPTGRAETPLQARVDLVQLDDGSQALMELELIEPSLYFRNHPQAASNFADAVEAWLRESRPSR